MIDPQTYSEPYGKSNTGSRATQGEGPGRAGEVRSFPCRIPAPGETAPARECA